MELDGSFSDRRERLFGRKPDVDYLLGRAQSCGLTAVIGRPKMGKTWLLEETARRLTEQGYLVGYHECRGQSSDLLLRTVADLYSRWLSNAGLVEQAKSLWRRHKDRCITAAGQAVGRLFEGVISLGAPPFAKVAELARQSFDGLARADGDLRTGGLHLSPLDYDQALELLRILADVSQTKMPIILVLDAWEKSTSIRFEHRTLSAFLSHITDWRDTHVVLGIRRPDHDNPQGEDVASAYAADLSNASASASVYPLGRMGTDQDDERNRMLSAVRAGVKAAADVPDDNLVGLIDGFPGVLDRWLAPTQTQMATVQDLRREALNAQKYRYREFDTILPALQPQERAFAVRVAIFPLLATETWATFRACLLGDIPEAIWHDLCVKGVLV